MAEEKNNSKQLNFSLFITRQGGPGVDEGFLQGNAKQNDTEGHQTKEVDQHDDSGNH